MELVTFEAMNRHLIVIPTYNEVENIAEIIHKIFSRPLESTGVSFITWALDFSMLFSNLLQTSLQVDTGLFSRFSKWFTLSRHLGSNMAHRTHPRLL